jgi:hypothetical protein
MTFFNEYTLSVLGIMFEIFGSFILTLEAFGSSWMDKPIKLFVKFSDWIGKRFWASVMIGAILIIPIIIGAFFGNKICTALFVPLLIFNLVFATIFDEAEKLEKWASLSFNNKKIGPIGFILLLIGNGLQMISTIIQIK